MFRRSKLASSGRTWPTDRRPAANDQLRGPLSSMTDREPSRCAPLAPCHRRQRRRDAGHHVPGADLHGAIFRSRRHQGSRVPRDRLLGRGRARSSRRRVRRTRPSAAGIPFSSSFIFSTTTLPGENSEIVESHRTVTPSASASSNSTSCAGILSGSAGRRSLLRLRRDVARCERHPSPCRRRHIRRRVVRSRRAHRPRWPAANRARR